MEGRWVELLTECTEFRDGDRRSDASLWNGGFGLSSESASKTSSRDSRGSSAETARTVGVCDVVCVDGGDG